MTSPSKNPNKIGFKEYIAIATTVMITGALFIFSNITSEIYSKIEKPKSYILVLGIVIFIVSIIFLVHYVTTRSYASKLYDVRLDISKDIDEYKNKLDVILSDSRLSMSRIINNSEEDIGALANHFETRLEPIIDQSNIDWLYREESYAKKIELVKNSHIWIISPDLENIQRGEVLRNTVVENILKGKKYTYIIPDPDKNSRIKMRLDKFKGYINEQSEKNGMGKLSDSNLKVIAVNEDRFAMMFLTHIALFNYDEQRYGEATEAYIELPVGVANRSEFDYWVKLNDRVTNNIKDKVDQIKREFDLGNYRE